MDRRIEWALAAMHAQAGRAVTIAALARDTNLSTSRFGHLFTQQVGTSPARYLHALRMIRARLLIERTSLSIKEVMSQVGCNDPSHFTRDFRRFHGVSPREHRWAAAHRPLRSESDHALASATVAHIAALANERRKRPTTGRPRRAARDLALHSSR